jgi:hypothetical protein
MAAINAYEADVTKQRPPISSGLLALCRTHLSKSRLLGRPASAHGMVRRRRHVGRHLTPRDALRFAGGEEVISNTDQPVRLAKATMELINAQSNTSMRAKLSETV